MLKCFLIKFYKRNNRFLHFVNGVKVTNINLVLVALATNSEMYYLITVYHIRAKVNVFTTEPLKYNHDIRHNILHNSARKAKSLLRPLNNGCGVYALLVCQAQ